MKPTPPRLRWHPKTWPAPVLNGLSVGVGLTALCLLIAVLAGYPQAVAASSGAAATSVADTVTALRRKRHSMGPAVLVCVASSALVALTHNQAWALSLATLLCIGASIFWMAWGKRGGPLTFVAVLSVVFQSAAVHGPHAHASLPDGLHLLWVAVGAVGIATWSGLSAWVLARRYRELALVDVLDGLVALMRRQARWTALNAQHATDAERSQALLGLLRAQAGLPEVLQAARDLIYTPAQQAGANPHLRHTIEALAQAVRLRDVLYGCQADLAHTPPGPASAAAMHHLASRLQAEAAHIQRCADGWRGRPWPSRVAAVALGAPPAHTAPPGDSAPMSAADQALHAALLRRVQHLSWVVDAIDAISPQLGQADLDGSTRIPSPLPPVDVLGQTALLHALTTPPGWPLANLRSQLRWQAPVARYAARTTLACGCALALGHAMPWASHPHWILMTVAVVMRGSLDQTLLRRDARIVGTLAGCLVAAALIALMPHPAWLLLPLALALSLAHGFVLLDYRVTAAAGAVLALLQSHLLSPGTAPLWVTVGERLADTVLGALLAWGFTHVWPTWERQQLPRLVGRLLECLARDVTQALKPASGTPPQAEAHLARRDTQEALAQLTQSLARMDKEPERVRRISPLLEQLLIACHRFNSDVAVVRNLRFVKGHQVAPEVAQPALSRAHRAVIGAFRATRPDAGDTVPMSPVLPGQHTFTDHHEDHGEVPATELDRVGGTDVSSTTAWLLHRLDLLQTAAQGVADAARPLRALDSASPR